jgi:chemotaxis protein methyltransferase CheR
LRDWNISILATDIDPGFLRKATLGIYSDWSFRDAPPGIKERFFKKTREGRFEIAPRIKSLVSFAYLNLAEDSYPSVENGTNAMDVVFCRNVLMYFEPARARKVLHGLGRSLMDGGWLFVSPVETPQVAVSQLVPVHFPGAIVHRKENNPASAKHVHADAIPCLPAGPESPMPGGLQLEQQPAPALPERPRKIGTVPGPERRQAEAPAQTPYQQAAALYGQGRCEEAVAKVLRIVAQSPNDAAAMALLARAYANQGRLAEASEWCKKALAVDKLNAGGWYLLATILQEQGLPEDAVSALRRALYLDQNNALVHFALGNLTRRQGRGKDAERHFRNALSILSAYHEEQVLNESEGITAGRLAEIIRSTLSSEAHT